MNPWDVYALKLAAMFWFAIAGTLGALGLVVFVMALAHFWKGARE